MLIELDHLILNQLQAFSNPLLDRFFLEVTILGSTTFLILVALGFWIAEKKSIAFLLSFALLVNMLVINSLKEIVARPRPGESITAMGDSFPSGHTSSAFVAFSILSYFFKQKKKYLFGLASLVGVSRLWIGVHYPSDVLAGALIGYGIGWLILRYQKREIGLAIKIKKLFQK